MGNMSEGKTLKSRLDLALERFQREDREAGDRTPLTDAQKASIAEVRNFYEAKIAELEVLHQGRLRAVWDPAGREALEEEYRRDRERLTTERDGKIEKARKTAT
jgi:hypothetical protein